MTGLNWNGEFCYSWLESGDMTAQLAQRRGCALDVRGIVARIPTEALYLFLLNIQRYGRLKPIWHWFHTDPFFPRANAAVVWSWQLIQLGASFMNAWFYTAIPPIRFHDMYKDGLTSNCTGNMKNRINVDSGWLREKSRRYNFKKKKLPDKFLRYWSNKFFRSTRF